MKQVFILIFATFSLLACNQEGSPSATKPLQAPSPSAIPPDYSATTPNQMLQKDVLDMIQLYHSSQYKDVNNFSSPAHATNFATATDKDSRLMYLNLDSLKRMIYFIEKASAKFTTEEKANLGINFYYAAYPAAMNKQEQGISLTNKHTLILIPAILNQTTGAPQDVDILANLNNPTKTNATFINGSYFNNATLNKTFMFAQNQGTLVPPPPTGTTILDLTDDN
jgi:hypothetical protein